MREPEYFDLQPRQFSAQAPHKRQHGGELDETVILKLVRLNATSEVISISPTTGNVTYTITDDDTADVT